MSPPRARTCPLPIPTAIMADEPADELDLSGYVPMCYLYHDDAPGYALVHPSRVAEEEVYGWFRLSPRSLDNKRPPEIQIFHAIETVDGVSFYGPSPDTDG